MIFLGPSPCSGSHAPAGEGQEQPRRADVGAQGLVGSPKQVRFGENMGGVVWAGEQRKAIRVPKSNY